MRCVYEEESDIIETYVTRCRLFTLVFILSEGGGLGGQQNENITVRDLYDIET